VATAKAMLTIDLGSLSYAEAEAVQTARLGEVSTGGEDTLYLVEHPPVITLGRNGGIENLHAGRGFLAERGIELAQSSRGGNITCHFPGQLVAYPVFRIERRPGGLRSFFHDLEEVVLRTLHTFGLEASRHEGRPGVWIDNRKICSIGVAVRRWTTYHGLALNVGRDLSLFNLITLCGLPDAEATSLHRELDDDSVTMQEVKDVLTRQFLAIFTHPAVAAGEAAL